MDLALPSCHELHGAPTPLTGEGGHCFNLRSENRESAVCPRCKLLGLKDPDVTVRDAEGNVLRVEPGRVACKPCDKAALKDAKKSWRGNRKMPNPYTLQHPQTIPPEKDLHKIAQQAQAREEAEQAVILFGPSADPETAKRMAQQTPEPEPEFTCKVLCACGCEQPVAEGKKLASRSCIGRYTALLKAEGKMFRRVRQPKPRMKPPSEKLKRTVREPRYVTPERKPQPADAYAVAVELARTYSLEQLRAAVSLREILG